MDNRFSSFNPNEERFAFKTSGTFRCDYKTGTLLQVLISAAAGVLIPTILSLGFGLSSMSGGDFVVSGVNGMLTAAWVYIAILAIILGWLVGMAIVRWGEEFSYYADSEKMTIKFPRDRQPQLVIRFDEKVQIFYNERKLFGKSQGYDVKLVMSSGEYTFLCKHNAASRSQGRRALPFYIIEERTGQAEKPEFYVR